MKKFVNQFPFPILKRKNLRKIKECNLLKFDPIIDENLPVGNFLYDLVDFYNYKKLDSFSNVEELANKYFAYNLPVVIAYKVDEEIIREKIEIRRVSKIFDKYIFWSLPTSINEEDEKFVSEEKIEEIMNQMNLKRIE
jgi:hypothetical protein